MASTISLFCDARDGYQRFLVSSGFCESSRQKFGMVDRRVPCLAAAGVLHPNELSQGSGSEVQRAESRTDHRAPIFTGRGTGRVGERSGGGQVNETSRHQTGNQKLA